MLRMEIALSLVVAFIAYVYFGADRKHTLLHRTFSGLLVVLLVHLVFDGITIYTVNHLDSVPELVNLSVHAIYLISINVTVYLYFLYLSVRAAE